MKKILVVLMLAVFALSAPMVMAQGDQPGAPKASGEKEVKSVNCCIKGQCKQVKGEADCTKDGGKIVKECKDCK
jgi:hypothetical protein